MSADNAHHGGVAEKNTLTELYKGHIRSFLPKLRSYKILRGADYLEKWINDELVPAPLIDVSGFRGRDRLSTYQLFWQFALQLLGVFGPGEMSWEHIM